MSRSLLAALLVLGGCTLGAPLEEPNPGALEPDGLREHDSRIQEIGEIGVSRTETIKAHAWRITLGTNERVSLYTAKYTGEESAVEIDTVLSLFKKGETGWGEPIAQNDDAAAGTVYSRVELDLEPGEYRLLVDATKATTRGWFGVNVRCADGYCNEFAPGPATEPEEYGTGEADEPGDGPVSFRAPIVDDEGDLLSRFNEDLTAAGLPTFPDFVTLSTVDEDPSAAWNAIYEQSSREDVAAAIEVEMMAYADPPSLPGLCYEGDGSVLAGFLWQFSDSVFSDQFVVYGWRAGGRSAYDEWHEPTSLSASYEDWQAFDPSGTDVLVIFSTDDDGNEQTATIPRCAAPVASE